jgi:hypothetical protein
MWLEASVRGVEVRPPFQSRASDQNMQNHQAEVTR